ncbi:MAG: hypothetical protein FJW54_03670, partial [Actinobacteria bacterium]|nr:hypothetical protein [Actinomycetota bacterium]
MSFDVEAEFISEVLEVTFLLSGLSFALQQFRLKIPVAKVLLFIIALTLYSDAPQFLILGGLFLVISEVDRRDYRIPDVLTKPALFGLSIWLIHTPTSLLLAWGWIAIMYAITYLAPTVVGRGDIKLVGVLVLVNEIENVLARMEFLVILLFLAS